MRRKAAVPPWVAPHACSLRRSEPKVEALQVLRALAAAAVMCFHGASLFEERAGGAWLGPLFRPGYHGVDVFFVLSGFIIHFAASGARGSREFLLKRFIRLYPVYWVVTGLLLVAYAAAPTPEMAHKGDPHVVLDSVLLLPCPRHVVGVAWTLVYEVWFYLLFGLLFFRSRLLFYAALSGWSALAWANALCGWRFESFALESLLRPIVAEFLIGGLAAVVFTRFRGRGAGFALGVGAAGLAGAWAAEIAGLRPWSVPAFGLPSALLVYGGAALRWRWPRWLVFLGDASYSLYLIHGTLISMLLKLAAWAGWLTLAAGPAGQLAIYAATLGGAALFHRLVEAPLLAACRRRWLRPGGGRASPASSAAPAWPRALPTSSPPSP